MTRFLLVCAGGAIGTGVRYLLGNWIIERLGTAFPYHTLVVNLLGSFLLGALMHVGVSTELMSPTVRFTLATGVLAASRPIPASITRRCATCNTAHGLPV